MLWTIRGDLLARHPRGALRQRGRSWERRLERARVRCASTTTRSMGLPTGGAASSCRAASVASKNSRTSTTSWSRKRRTETPSISTRCPVGGESRRVDGPEVGAHEAPPVGELRLLERDEGIAEHLHSTVGERLVLSPGTFQGFGPATCWLGHHRVGEHHVGVQQSGEAVPVARVGTVEPVAEELPHVLGCARCLLVVHRNSLSRSPPGIIRASGHVDKGGPRLPDDTDRSGPPVPYAGCCSASRRNSVNSCPHRCGWSNHRPCPPGRTSIRPFGSRPAAR